MKPATQAKQPLAIRTRFVILLGWMAISLVLYGLWSIKLMREVRVNGPIYQHIVQSKDLVADILPPPEYIIESYLLTYELQAAANPAAHDGLKQRLLSLRHEFEARHRYWQEQDLEAPLQETFLQRAYHAAQQFYVLAERDFLPALERQDQAAASAAMQAMRAQYEQHRLAIDQVVQLANQRVEQDEHTAHRRVDAANWQLPLLLLLALAASIGGSVQILRSLFRQLGGDPALASRLARQIATGDLAVAIRLRSDYAGSLLHAMQMMRDQLAKLVAQVWVAAETISSASAQIATGNQDLTGRTAQQATALEQTARATQALSSVVAQNAQRALHAHQLSSSADASVQQGRQVVSQLLHKMDSVDASSRRITDITSVIESIAFQTNILALNAAVEAARAGEQGRGFAVVASEVRALAQRSHVAAAEIKHLIADSVAQIQAGNTLAEQADVSMQQVVQRIEQVRTVMGEIAESSQVQSQDMRQLHQSVQLMDSATQENAALVEEAASAADALREQAQQMIQLVSVFQLHDETDCPKGHHQPQSVMAAGPMSPSRSVAPT